MNDTNRQSPYINFEHKKEPKANETLVTDPRLNIRREQKVLATHLDVGTTRKKDLGCQRSERRPDDP